ncbi:class I SAM-dependent methyltransferase [Roseateles sp. SL47]|uniref:class I SAM-dependent methyltransferase n=1 Tax=Roseateles sp. SL47 TaxID=2995138 RepID=UPI00226D7761|nr:class I SAM-dependent methyltransferase [Roseateles sp. SL47]WAC72291.1 class I SAM-dependent methyltransferase [Roseateles sp. SL47]
MPPSPPPPPPQAAATSSATAAALSSHPSPAPASDWVLRWRQAWERPGSTALDVGCGHGRHVRLLAGAGVQVTGVDRDAEALAGLRELPQVEIIQADIEAGPWPLQGRQFDLVLVTHYLWRPLLPLIKAAVAPGGWLIYETFTEGQQTIGRPSRPDFLLRPGELLSVCEGFRVVAFEDGFLEPASGALPLPTGETPPVNGRYVQRVAAVHASGDGPSQPPRYRLNP